MKPGRELDAIIAEKVMGWTRKEVEEADFYTNEAGGTSHDLPLYSTSIEAAWEVVDRLAPEWKMYLKSDRTKPREWVQGCTYTLARYAKATFLHFQNGKTVEAEAETVPRAICLAALKAVGVKG